MVLGGSVLRVWRKTTCVVWLGFREVEDGIGPVFDCRMVSTVCTYAELSHMAANNEEEKEFYFKATY
jgi:hypothetical protein